MNIAILSPSKNAYSETFIQVQKNNLKGTVFYYYDGQVPSRLEGHGSIIIKHAGLKRKLGLLSTELRLESLKRSLKKNKIDVVLAQYGPTGNAVSQICADIQIPLVVHFHGYDATITKVISKNDYYKTLFKIAKSVISVSKVMTKDLINIGCPESKIVQNTYGPSPIFHKVARSKKVKKQFIAIGRFTDKKAPYFTILAFHQVLKKHPDAKLVFGGDGVLLNTCINLVRHLKIENAVSFEGIISQDIYAKYLSESIAFVQHSMTAENGDKEGTPVAILEASGAGLPVVSTFHAGIPDVVLHEETGLLSNEGDVNMMAEQMLYIIENQDKANEMGFNGKAHIENNYSLEKHISKLQDTLQSAVDNE